jgi:histidinol-phosphatase (PHP family)
MLGPVGDCWYEDQPLALEVDYVPGHEDWIRDLAAGHPWSYMIGSVHYLSGNWAVDHQDNLAGWKTRDVWEIWAPYFDRLTQAAASGLFDVIDHPDLLPQVRDGETAGL